DMEGLRAGESKGSDGMVKITADHWGIPAQTLDALKMRGIPASQVTGEYGRHFYSDLYSNGFYAREGHGGVDIAAQIAQEREVKKASGQTRVVSQTYIPLQ
ncbi:unnamed protein product, partial [Polarella glacialis]